MDFYSHTYRIYDLPVSIQVAECYKTAQKKIHEQLGKYGQTTEEARIRVILSPDLLTGEITNNPSLHALVKNGFIIKYPKYTIAYTFIDGNLTIQIQLKYQGAALFRYLKKLNNIQYNSLEERAVQIIWENCLYPAFYFLKGYCIVHSSGFSVNNSEALLLGGTGGVGKTSLELALAKDGAFGFLNDDIAVLGENGNVYPNLSWPKIYAYNIMGNPEIRSLILKGRSLDNKLAFLFKKTLFGLNKVRRTIDPHILFSQTTNQSLPLKTFIFLSKGNYSTLNLRPFPSELVPSLNINIIKSEFADFERHINWHGYNSALAQSEAIVDTTVVHKQWEEIQKAIFKGVRCYVMEIPGQIQHKTFVSDACRLILELYR